jgi:hypothetical protein
VLYFENGRNLIVKVDVAEQALMELDSALHLEADFYSKTMKRKKFLWKNLLSRASTNIRIRNVIKIVNKMHGTNLRRRPLEFILLAKKYNILLYYQLSRN